MSFLRLGYKRHCCCQLGWSLPPPPSHHLPWGKPAAMSGSRPTERPVQQGTQVSCQQSLSVSLEVDLLDQSKLKRLGMVMLQEFKAGDLMVSMRARTCVLVGYQRYLLTLSIIFYFF